MAPHEFSELPVAQTAEAGDVNPYASPQAEGPLLAKDIVTEPVGIWRAGNVLIMHRACALPMRCVVSNLLCDATEQHELVLDSKRTIRAAQAAVGLIGGLLSVGFLFSKIQDRHIPAAGCAVLTVLIISLFTLRRPQELKFRYCITHSVQLRRLLLRSVGGLIFVAGLLIPFVALVGIISLSQKTFTVSFLIWLFLMIGAGVTFLLGRFPLRIERPPGNYLLIHGCGRDFITNFPEAAIGMPFLGRIFPKPSS